MKKVSFALVFVCMASIAGAQGTPDRHSPKKQIPQGQKLKSVKKGKANTGNPHHPKSVIKHNDTTLSGAGHSGAGVESADKGLNQMDTAVLKAGKPRVASENAGPGQPASNKYHSNKRIKKRSVKATPATPGQSDSSGPAKEQPER